MEENISREDAKREDREQGGKFCIKKIKKEYWEKEEN